MIKSDVERSEMENVKLLVDGSLTTRLVESGCLRHAGILVILSSPNISSRTVSTIRLLTPNPIESSPRPQPQPGIKYHFEKLKNYWNKCV